ncbi:MAG: GNAT family N-acetyltransferase [Desulfobacterales bacterium]|nr:GNAT family N-acetyltransferase [Desulfobacterales bacterium]
MSRGVQYYLLYAAENPIGCVAIEKASADLFYLERLSVLPEMRGRHFGIQLVQHALACAAAKGARKIGIGIIDAQADLKAWYTRLGFVVTGTKSFLHLPFTVCLMEFGYDQPAGPAARPGHQ